MNSAVSLFLFNTPPVTAEATKNIEYARLGKCFIFLSVFLILYF